MKEEKAEKNEPSKEINRWRIEERLRIILNYRENLTADVNELIEEDAREVYKDLYDSIMNVVSFETKLLGLYFGS